MMTTKRIPICVLEQEIAGDTSGTKIRELIDKINSYKTWVTQRMNEGLSNSEFEAYSQLKEAVLKAEEILQKLNQG